MPIEAEREINMTINLNNASTINNAIGNHGHWSCKPVLNLDTGEVYASATDAAEVLGVCYESVSKCCRGIYKTAGGHRLSYAKHASENIDELTAALREMCEKMAQLEVDAAVGRAIREEQEAKQKAEEERKNAIEQAEMRVCKANERIERRARIIERKQEELRLALSRLAEAKNELTAAQEALSALNGNEAVA